MGFQAHEYKNFEFYFHENEHWISGYFRGTFCLYERNEKFIDFFCFVFELLLKIGAISDFFFL